MMEKGKRNGRERTHITTADTGAFNGNCDFSFFQVLAALDIF